MKQFYLGAIFGFLFTLSLVCGFFWYNNVTMICRTDSFPVPHCNFQ